MFAAGRLWLRALVDIDLVQHENNLVILLSQTFLTSRTHLALSCDCTIARRGCTFTFTEGQRVTVGIR